MTWLQHTKQRHDVLAGIQPSYNRVGYSHSILAENFRCSSRILAEPDLLECFVSQEFQHSHLFTKFCAFSTKTNQTLCKFPPHSKLSKKHRRHFFPLCQIPFFRQSSNSSQQRKRKAKSWSRDEKSQNFTSVWKSVLQLAEEEKKKVKSRRSLSGISGPQDVRWFQLLQKCAHFAQHPLCRKFWLHFFFLVPSIKFVLKFFGICYFVRFRCSTGVNRIAQTNGRV